MEEENRMTTWDFLKSLGVSCYLGYWWDKGREGLVIGFFIFISFVIVHILNNQSNQ